MTFSSIFYNHFDLWHDPHYRSQAEKYLKDHPNFDFNTTDDDGNSYIMYKLSQRILGRGLDVSKIKFLVGKGADVNIANNRGETALIIAARNIKLWGYNTSIIETLIDSGAHVNVQDRKGHTPAWYLVSALYNNDNSYYAERIEQLLRGLVKLGANFNLKDKAGNRIIHSFGFLTNHLNRQEELKRVRFFHSLGADLSMPNKDGLTLAHEIREPNAFRFLVRARANLNAVDNLGNTTLHSAINYNKNHLIIKLLLDAGVDINKHNTKGWTPLHLALDQNRDISIIKLLLKAGADVNKPTPEGWTPLHLAAYRDNAEAVDLLLKAPKIKFTAEILSGELTESVSVPTDIKTPLDVAEYCESNDIADKIWQAMQALTEGDDTEEILDNKDQRITQLTQEVEHYKQKVAELEAKLAHAQLELSRATIHHNADAAAGNIEIRHSELQVYIHQPLGAGTYGQVFRGRYHGMNVAVKQLIEGSVTKQSVKDFEKEVLINVNVRHDNCVRFYGACLLPPYSIVMELMTGGSLYELLATGNPLPWKKRYSIAKDIAQGLSYLHKNDIIHRDIKSLNVLLSDTGRAKLSDYGYARTKQNSLVTTRTKTAAAASSEHKALGTIAWLAPELLQDRRPKHSTQTDMYSYGMLLWELASRAIPFRDAISEQQVYRWVEKGMKEDIPDDTPAPFRKLINNLWNAPNKRPTASETVHAITEIEQGIEQFKPLMS